MKPINAMFIGLSIISFSIAMLVGIEGVLLSSLNGLGEYVLTEPDGYGKPCCMLWFIAVACLIAGADRDE